MIKGSAAKYAAALLAAGACMGAQASSHREAPFITEQPKVDGTDFYMFRSYEPGRDGFVTILANYLPLQDPYGGPNYFSMDPNALYEVMIDNDGDAVEDITFQFRFTNTYKGLSLPIGPDGSDVAVPLLNIGGIGPNAEDTDNLGLIETYTLTLVRGDRRTGIAEMATNMDDGGTTFAKPIDYIGTKSLPDYETYAEDHIQTVGIPGCSDGRVFVGQRKEGFVVNLGEVFDLVNLNPLGARDARPNTIGNKNVTTMALEVPVDCLVGDGGPIVGGWTTASLRQARVLNPVPQGPTTDLPDTKGPAVEGGAWTQVSRLGSPLVNEVVIGVPDKDAFNASLPKDDLDNFATYVTNPTLPVLLNVLFGVEVPATPRNDLVAAFVTGITATVNGAPFNFTQPADQTGVGEMLRLNTAVGPVPAAEQSDLGFLACDLGGFPNGRRPYDDVTDIALNVALGAIAENPNNLQTCDVSGETPVVVNEGAVVNDGAEASPSDYMTVFPYLATPLPGAGGAAPASVAALR